MANLFFIHTPLQLMIAQQIIRQEELVDNVMLMGYVDDNTHFLEIYDLIIMEEMWRAKVLMPQIDCWAVMSRKHILRDGKNAYTNYKFIKKTIKHYHVDTLFLGDMNDSSCQLAAISFHKKGLKICFFEEGAGHYGMNYNYGMEGNYIDKIYSILIDTFYYRPLYGVYFAYIHYWKGFRLEMLPIDIRYSVVPFYHESFDKLVTCKLQVTDKIKKLIETELAGAHENGNVLMLTSPFYIIHGDNDDPSLYIRIIVDTLCQIKGDVHVWLKFHPRETEDVADEVCRQLDSNGVKYHVLGKMMKLPIEYYLQIFHFDEVIMFLCSSYFYNGYLFPKTKFTSILRPYYELCKSEGSEYARYLEPFVGNNSLSLND